MRVDFEVTEEDIATGARKACRNCPLALAVARKLAELGSHREVRVYAQAFELSERFMGRVCEELKSVDAKMLPSCLDFIETFDAGKPVYPFGFSLEIPDEVFAKS